MKKTLTFLLAILLTLSMAACVPSAEGGDGNNMQIWMVIACGALLVFFVVSTLLRNKKKAQQVAETDSKFVVGATVITVGGVLGTIVEINEKDNTFTIEMLPDGVKMTVVRGGLYGIKPDAKEEEPVVDYDEAVVSSDDVGHESAVSYDDEIK